MFDCDVCLIFLEFTNNPKKLLTAFAAQYNFLFLFVQKLVSTLNNGLSPNIFSKRFWPLASSCQKYFIVVYFTVPQFCLNTRLKNNNGTTAIAEVPRSRNVHLDVSVYEN